MNINISSESSPVKFSSILPGDVSEELRSDKYNHCFDITPRIGGVGLMTRAMLMCNTAHVFTK